jgi:hypothetical protein
MAIRKPRPRAGRAPPVVPPVVVPLPVPNLLEGIDAVNANVDALFARERVDVQQTNAWTKVIFFHFSSNGVLFWDVDVDGYVIGYNVVTSTARFDVAAHNPTEPTAAQDTVYSVGRFFVSAVTASAGSRMRIPWRAGEKIYVRNQSGAELFVCLHFEVVVT